MHAHVLAHMHVVIQLIHLHRCAHIARVLSIVHYSPVVHNGILSDYYCNMNSMCHTSGQCIEASLQ